MHGSNASSSSSANSGGSNYPFNFYRPTPQMHSLAEQKSRPATLGNILHPAMVQPQQHQKQQQQHPSQLHSQNPNQTQHLQQQQHQHHQQQQQPTFDGRSRVTRSFNPAAAEAVNGGTEPGISHFGNSHIFMTDPHMSTVFSNYAKSVGMPPNNLRPQYTTFPGHVSSVLNPSVASVQQQQQQQQNHHPNSSVAASSALDNLLHNCFARRPNPPTVTSSSTPPWAVTASSATSTVASSNDYSASVAAVAAAAAAVAAVTSGGPGRYHMGPPHSTVSSSSSPSGAAALVTPTPAFPGILPRTGGASLSSGNSNTLVELLFHSSNLIQVGAELASSIALAVANLKAELRSASASALATACGEQAQEQNKNLNLVQWMFTPQHKINAVNFIQWACACTRSFRRDRLLVWPRTQSEIDALHSMNWLVAPPGLLGVYSQSPFLRPVRLLRRVQFATPGTVCTTLPDPDNMVRTLREMADSQVARRTTGLGQNSLSVLSGTAASFGFTTDFMTYVFTFELDRQVIRLLSEQVKQQTSSIRHGRVSYPEWRVVLRFGWATSDFYIPPSAISSNPAQQQQQTPIESPHNRVRRALVLESLPRMLMVRVAGRAVPLPEPIFHSGQAQKLGKRLRLSIDLTDKLPIRANAPLRSRVIDVEVSWLHAPLEDHPSKLLDMVVSEQMSPLFCHLIGLPLVQVTLDRAYSTTELRQVFAPPIGTDRLLDLQQTVSPPPWIRHQTEAEESAAVNGVLGAYDNCIPPWQHITVTVTKQALLKKLETLVDAELSISGVSSGNSGDVKAAEDYIPLCLLCPITRQRIETPVRSIHCEHLQCFDLCSYLTISYRRPRWSCPICSCQATFRDLRLDDFFAAILVNARSQNATFIHVDASGDWRLSPEEAGGDGDGGTCLSEVPRNSSASAAVAPHVPAHAPVGPPPLSCAPPHLVNSQRASPQAGSVTTTNNNHSGLPVQQMVSKNESTVGEPVPCGSSTAGDFEVIVLSDDDESDQEERLPLRKAAAMLDPVPSTGAGGRQTTLPFKGHPGANVPHLTGFVDFIKSPNSNSNQLQIDLTNEDSDEEEEEEEDDEDSSVSTSSSSSNLECSGPSQAPSSNNQAPEILRVCKLQGGPSETPPTATLGKTTPTTTAVGGVQSGPFVLLTPVLHRPDDENLPEPVTLSAPSGLRRLTSSSDLAVAGGDSEGRRKLTSLAFTNGGGGAFFPTAGDGDRQEDVDGPPGVDIFDYSDGGQQLMSEPRPNSKPCSLSGRSRPPVLKESQSNALTRLVHQRMARTVPSSLPPTDTNQNTMENSSATAQAVGRQPPLLVRIPSRSITGTTLASTAPPQTRRRMKQTQQCKRFRHRQSPSSSQASDEESESEGDALSNASVFTSENSSNNEEEEDALSNDSDSSWVPPSENRRRRSSDASRGQQRQQPKRARGAGGNTSQMEKRISRMLMHR